MFGQIPTNGSWRGGDGIFGQVPTNGGYTVGAAARGPSLGSFPMGTVYVAPPAYNDGGLLRIDQSSAPAFEWSINSTTTDDPAQGATTHIAEGFLETYLMEIVSTPGQPGNSWMSTYMAAGYVVLFRGKSVDELNPMLSFIVTTDPRAIKHFAAYNADNYMVVGGPEEIIAAAKMGGAVEPPSLPPTQPPSVPGMHPPPCGAGEQEVYGMCFPIPQLPGGPPGTPPPQPGGGCGPNQISVAGQCLNTPPCGAGEQEVYGVCYPLPTLPGVPPGTQPPGVPPLPGVPPGTTPPPGTAPPTQPPVQPGQPTPPVHVAGAGAPPWLFPVLIGVAGLSVFVIMRASRKKGRTAT